MAMQTVNLGSGVGAGDGDGLRSGGDKINDNFTELYGGGSSIRIAASNTPSAFLATAQYVCDGTADEVQINAALAVGVPVRLLPGSYSTAAAISVPSNARIEICTGATVTLAAASNVPVLTNSDAAGGNVNIVIEGGGVFDHNGSNQSTASHGVLLDNVTGLTLASFKATNGRGWDVDVKNCRRVNIERVEAYGPAHAANEGGLRVQADCQYVALSDVICRDHTLGFGYGLWLMGTDVIATNCFAYGNDDDNLVIGNASANDARRVTVVGGFFTGSVADAGCHITSGCNGVHISGAVFSDNDAMGIKVSGTNVFRVSLDGIIACDNGESGVAIAVDRTLVTGCTIEGNTQRGIFINGSCSKVQILNSKIRGNTGNNIEAHSTVTISDFLIANNLLESSSARGIALNGTRDEIMIVGNFFESNTSGGLLGGGAASGVTTQLNWGAQKPTDVDERD